MTPSPACNAIRNDDAAEATTVGDVLIHWARRTPYRIALTDAGAPGAPPRSWTCEALRDDAATLAVALLSRFAPGERIAVWASSCPEAVLLQFAAALAGLTLVAIDPACLGGELTQILDHSGAVGLFTMTTDGGRAPPRDVASAAAALREVVELSDRRTLFAKRRCVDGLPDVRPLDPAQIRYPAGEGGFPGAEAVLQCDLADALRGAIARGTPRGDALLPQFPRSRPPGDPAAVGGECARFGGVVVVA
ncbi:MAG: fatty-acyl-CoA synthase [Caulobacteraceae bacterium]|nr:fatty-acyl-CoA synthase [Caulobacteraceae bacterium]